ncbi:prephenate dehydrogenase [Cellulosimicrobium marinum]|uniref:prephenate dehydrogenase n=1 Tax=Cellulosimicrobium marinum TaxID=1638992 RepID=UPI001E374895|nr:prephenate dehydrogenase/arogenate dehydrogenase family protein [Cellulosimicrobium marinum]MCB7136521.1 prephenate dehydrogenase/arogenate dehydrogenase family protein [Cellulosimicrobium marinum]
MTDARPTVGVVGLGLVGGSLARLLHDRGVRVTGHDATDATRAAARTAGLRVAPDLAALCAQEPDVLVLAVPLRAMRTVASEVARHVRGGTVVSDVGSVKGAVREAVRAAGLDDRYVGAHPMAGTERSGFAASDAAMLDGARWAVTVDASTRADALATVLRLVTGPLGGTAHVVTDDVHDESAALVSHVPHVLATELLGVVADAPVRDVALGLAAGSFRDTTRVARTDPRRTEAMVTDNAAWVASALRVVVRDLERLVEALESNGPVGEFFDRPDPVRVDRSEQHEPQDVVLDEQGRWRRTLTDLGAQGRVVVAVRDDAVVVR